MSDYNSVEFTLQRLDDAAMEWVIAFRQKAFLDIYIKHLSQWHLDSHGLTLSSNSNNCNSSNLNASQDEDNTTVYGHFFKKFYGLMMDCKMCLYMYGCCTHRFRWAILCSRQTINKIKMIQNNKCPWTQWTMGSLRWNE